MATTTKSRTIVVTHKYTGHQASFILMEIPDGRAMGIAFERSLVEALTTLGVPHSEIGYTFVDIKVK